MKIEIKKLTIKNFLSVGNTPLTIDFKKGLRRVQGINKETNDTNGVGKCVDGETIVDINFVSDDVKDKFVNFINNG